MKAENQIHVSIEIYQLKYFFYQTSSMKTSKAAILRSSTRKGRGHQDIKFGKPHIFTKHFIKFHEPAVTTINYTMLNNI